MEVCHYFGFMSNLNHINTDLLVPVILIFTKFESQESQAFKTLKNECSMEEALARAPAVAQQKFNQEHLSRFKDRIYPPKDFIYLKSGLLFVDCEPC